MRTVGAYEAKTHLPRLLEEVERGEQVTITKHGRPVAILVPAGRTPGRSPQEAVDAMKEFGRGRSLGGLTVRQLVEEGREY